MACSYTGRAVHKSQVQVISTACISIPLKLWVRRNPCIVKMAHKIASTPGIILLDWILDSRFMNSRPNSVYCSPFCIDGSATGSLQEIVCSFPVLQPCCLLLYMDKKKTIGARPSSPLPRHEHRCGLLQQCIAGIQHFPLLTSS